MIWRVKATSSSMSLADYSGFFIYWTFVIKNKVISIGSNFGEVFGDMVEEWIRDIGLKVHNKSTQKNGYTTVFIRCLVPFFSVDYRGAVSYASQTTAQAVVWLEWRQRSLQMKLLCKYQIKQRFYSLRGWLEVHINNIL